MIKELLDRTRIYLILFDPFFKLEMSPTVEAHQAIVDALAEGSADKAAQAVHEHLQSSVERLETVELIPEDYLSL